MIYIGIKSLISAPAISPDHFQLKYGQGKAKDGGINNNMALTTSENLQLSLGLRKN
jgi:hypothetical protein